MPCLPVTLCGCEDHHLEDKKNLGFHEVLAYVFHSAIFFFF